MNDDDLDALLSAPLPELADTGFSTRVASKIAERQGWWDRLTVFAPVVAVAAALPFVPAARLTDAALHVTPLIANSAALSIAAAALVITISVEQRLREWQSAL